MKNRILLALCFLLFSQETVLCQNSKENLAKDYYEQAQGSAMNGYLQKSAELGYAPAQYDLAICYSNGFGNQPNDYQTAVKWLKKAANQGYVKAQNKLGIYYQNGYGVRQSDKDAVKWYKKAAEQGYADAQNNLAICYFRGSGVKQNKEKAREWFEKAAVQGNRNAKYALEEYYY